MNKEKYLQTQMTIVQLGKVASQLDLESFISTISNAETVAPILDPTLFIKAQNNLGAIKTLAQSLLPVKKAFDETFKAVLETELKEYMEKPLQP